MAETHRFTVDSANEGKRLDLFLSNQLPDISRSEIQRWISADRVTVDGKVKKASHRITAGESVQARSIPPEPTEVEPEKIPLEVLHEDNEIIVINKPAGLVVHPGAGNWSGTLANALMFHFQEVSRADTLRPGIIHRLDKGTSGVLVVAKDDRTHQFISKQFSERTVKKRYLTLVFGRLEPSRGTIDLAIGRDAKLRTKISPRTSHPRDALTSYEVDRYFESFSYLSVEPKTGRTHQIRVHLHHMGHPVVGDETYMASKDQLRRLETPIQGIIRNMNRLFLHATSLEFIHPSSRLPVRFEAPLPQQLEDLLNSLGE